MTAADPIHPRKVEYCIPAPEKSVLVQCSFCLKMAAHTPNRVHTYECSQCHELTNVKDGERGGDGTQDPTDHVGLTALHAAVKVQVRMMPPTRTDSCVGLGAESVGFRVCGLWLGVYGVGVWAVLSVCSRASLPPEKTGPLVRPWLRLSVCW